MHQKKFYALKERWKSHKKASGTLLLLLAVVMGILLLFCRRPFTENKGTGRETTSMEKIMQTNEKGETMENVQEEESTSMLFGDNEAPFDEEVWEQNVNGIKVKKKSQKEQTDYAEKAGQNQIEKKQLPKTADKNDNNNASDRKDRKDTVAWAENMGEKNTGRNDYSQIEERTETVTETGTIPETTTRKPVKPGDDGWTPIVKP